MTCRRGARRRTRREAGQGLAEYALILAFIALVAIAALIFMGEALSTILSEIAAAVDAAPPL